MPYRQHLSSSTDLITPYEEIRAGFVALAMERNRRATPFVEQARALKVSAMQVKASDNSLHIKGIRSADDINLKFHLILYIFGFADFRSLQDLGSLKSGIFFGELR